jgi:hypothetical protein
VSAGAPPQFSKRGSAVETHDKIGRDVRTLIGKSRKSKRPIEGFNVSWQRESVLASVVAELEIQRWLQKRRLSLHLL